MNALIIFDMGFVDNEKFGICVLVFAKSLTIINVDIDWNNNEQVTG